MSPSSAHSVSLRRRAQGLLQFASRRVKILFRLRRSPHRFARNQRPFAPSSWPSEIPGSVGRKCL